MRELRTCRPTLMARGKEAAMRSLFEVVTGLQSAQVRGLGWAPGAEKPDMSTRKG